MSRCATIIDSPLTDAHTRRPEHICLMLCRIVRRAPAFLEEEKREYDIVSDLQRPSAKYKSGGLRRATAGPDELGNRVSRGEIICKELVE